MLPRQLDGIQALFLAREMRRPQFEGLPRVSPDLCKPSQSDSTQFLPSLVTMIHSRAGVRAKLVFMA